jgi:hypothetical protein
VTTVTCGACGASLDEPPAGPRAPCPVCSSRSRRFGLELVGEVKPHGRLRGKAKRPGRRRAFIEFFTGSDFFKAARQWRHVDRVIDREKNRYTERIADAAGVVIEDVAEPLSQHRGHGAAKRRPPNAPPLR